MLLLCFHDVLLLQAAAKVQYCIYGLNKLDFKMQGSTEFITLRPLVAPSLRSGAGPSGYKFRRPLCFEV